MSFEGMEFDVTIYTIDLEVQSPPVSAEIQNRQDPAVIVRGPLEARDISQSKRRLRAVTRNGLSAGLAVCRENSATICSLYQRTPAQMEDSVRTRLFAKGTRVVLAPAYSPAFECVVSFGYWASAGDYVQCCIAAAFDESD